MLTCLVWLSIRPKGATFSFHLISYITSQLLSTGKPLPWWLYTQTWRWSCFKRSMAGDILLFVTMLPANDFWLVNRLSVDDFWLLNWRDTRPNCHQIRPERLKSDHAWTLVTLIISHNGWMLETMSRRRFFEKSGRGDIMKLTNLIFWHTDHISQWLTQTFWRVWVPTMNKQRFFVRNLRLLYERLSEQIFQ